MEIKIHALALSISLLIIPLIIFRHLKVKLTQQLLISFGRMIVQLALVGLLLTFLFKSTYIWMTLLWMLIMLSNAVLILRGRLKFQRKILTPIFLTSLFAATLVVIPWILFVAIRPDPIFSADFIIPIYGIVLGNSMNGVAIALERFESNLSGNWKAYTTRLSLGANLWEAALPTFRQAMHASLLPQLLNIAAMGVVSLPGMMSGQILGGAPPLVAIKYQMMVMAAVFSAVTLADYIAIRLYLMRRFDKYYLPKA